MEKIGRYQVEHELGRGAMGVVYRAFDPAIGRPIAIKTIRLDEIGDSQSRASSRERLLREAQSAGILSHPNIVTIYDISEDQENAYIFMEFIEGATLDTFARGMPVPDLLSILEQAAEALDYAHLKGIVHRDIKPANLMLAGTVLKIADFGVARLLHRDTKQAGTLLGTPSYMSPEQIQGGDVSGASDQYALAVIAYEFLNGAKPFESDSLANLLFQIIQHPVPPIPRISAAANEVLRKALAKTPGARYLNCLSFVGDLAYALGADRESQTPARQQSGDEPTIAEIPVPPIPSTPAFPLPPPEPPSRWRAILIAALALTFVLALTWFRFWREPEPQPVAVAPLAPAAETTSKPSAAGEKVESPGEPLPRPVDQPLETQPQPAPAGVSYSVSFSAIPENAEILINNGNQDRCPATPCSLELPAGTFQATAKAPGFNDARRSIRVPDQLQIIFEMEKQVGTLAVNSNPAGASIRVNGKDTGEKTPAMLKLSPGTYKLEIVKEGLPVQGREITLRAGAVQTLTVEWNQ